MKLDLLLEIMCYPKVVEEALRNVLTVEKDKIVELSKTAYADGIGQLLCEQEPLTRLAVVTWLLQKKYEDYKKKHVPHQVIVDTFDDVSLRARLYYERKHEVGYSEEDVIWARHIMSGIIFKIGVLQYQIFDMLYMDKIEGEDYMTFQPEWEEKLPAGVPVLNCHIQCGADLSEETVTESFKKARTFFATVFPEIPFQAFICYSWLLYPDMCKELSVDSNIRKFAGRFEIIGTGTDQMHALKNISMNKATTLQKLAVEKRESLGLALGIIEW